MTKAISKKNSNYNSSAFKVSDVWHYVRDNDDSSDVVRRFWN
jgi:hypothetical protein